MDDCCKRAAEIAARQVLRQLEPFLGPAGAPDGTIDLALELTKLEFQKHPSIDPREQDPLDEAIEFYRSEGTNFTKLVEWLEELKKVRAANRS